MSARAVVLALLVATPAASTLADGARVQAAQAVGRIRLDGRLDEAAWAHAEPFSSFVQAFPVEGGAPAEATEVRVLYGERALYVGVRCRDGAPGDVVSPLGRRDHPPVSDQIAVVIDAANDRRTALLFSLTAGGVQSDAIVTDDDQVSYDWDAAWEGAATVDEEGWTAELAIPLSVLGDRARSRLTWGFGVVRDVARSHEKSASFPLARTGAGLVTRLGALDGLADLSIRSGVVVSPYVAQRVQLRPQFSDAAHPWPRLADASGDLGLDLRATFQGLSLSGTLNPDFGQVEADEVLLNLSTFEPFFPEKRPFFTEGADAFQPVGAGRERVPQQLFYSRRVGQDAPILGAAKLVGQPAGGLKIGVLDALVVGSGQAPGATEDAPDRAMAWTAARPLHVGPADAQPLVAPPSQNFFAAVARLPVSDTTVVGAQAVSALPLEGACTAAQAAAADGSRPASCDGHGGDAAALDFSTLSRDGEWYAYGQVAASRVEGGPPERTLRDGTTLRRGDLGAGTYLRAGKRGGDGLRADLAWTYASPTLDLNAAGFQRTQNEQEGGTTIKYVRSNLGPFHELSAVTGGYARWTTDGRGLSRGLGAAAGFDAQLKDPYVFASCRVRWTDPRYDVREISGSGIPLRRPPTEEAGCDVSTDAARAVSASFGGYAGRNLPAGPLEGPAYHGVNAGVALRPHPRLETRVSGAYDLNTYGVRYVGPDGADALLFGALRAPTVSLTVRQLVVLSPRLTFQLYGQLFTAYERFGPFYSARPSGTAPIEPAAMTPAGAPAASPDAHTSALVLNAVLRWEYRPGTTLYVVYARNQAERPFEDGDAPHVLAPRGLALGPTTDSFLLKWTFRFAR